jgi:hypothetical protein
MEVVGCIQTLTVGEEWPFEVFLVPIIRMRHVDYSRSGGPTASVLEEHLRFYLGDAMFCFDRM